MLKWLRVFIGLSPRGYEYSVENSNSDKKPRGEADWFSLALGAAWEGNKATYPKEVGTWPPVWKLQIGILFPPLSLCSHRETALGLRIAPVNGEKRPMCECFNNTSKPLSL